MSSAPTLDTGTELTPEQTRRFACDALIIPAAARVDIRAAGHRTREPCRAVRDAPRAGPPGRALRVPRLLDARGVG